MHSFLARNRDELIARCRAKIGRHARRHVTDGQLANGVPLFLDQLQRTLEASQFDAPDGSDVTGPAPASAFSPTRSARAVHAAHCKQLHLLGYSVAQVVHDYGDLRQSIKDLAVQLDAPFNAAQLQQLNRCLDDAIADTVEEFSLQRDSELARQHGDDINERVGFLVHELRNALSTATLAVSALELGNLTLAGATGAVLKRSHVTLARLVDQALEEVRHHGDAAPATPAFSVALFIADASGAAGLHARARRCLLSTPPVDPELAMCGDRGLLLGAVANLLQNAFKFTHEGTEVMLHAFGLGDRLHIDVRDHCGGLPAGNAERMFTPFSQRSNDRSGLGLGLSIARQSVQGAGGTISVRDVPGIGCVFTIDLPRHTLQ